MAKNDFKQPGVSTPDKGEEFGKLILSWKGV